MGDILKCILDRRLSQKYLPFIDSFYSRHDAFIRMYSCMVCVEWQRTGLQTFMNVKHAEWNLHVGRPLNDVFSRVDRVCSNTRLQVARKNKLNKFCEMTPNIYFSSFPYVKSVSIHEHRVESARGLWGSWITSLKCVYWVWNLLHVTLLDPKIWW